MRNTFSKISLLLLAFIGLYSCTTESLDTGLDTPENPINQKFFTAVIDTSSYNTQAVSAAIEGGILNIQASTEKGVFLIANQGALTGTYTNGQTDFIYIDIENQKTYTSKHPINGNSESVFTITNINFEQKTISGTFSFIGYYLVSEGQVNDNGEVISDPVIEQKIFSQGTMLNIPYGAGIINPIDPSGF